MGPLPQSTRKVLPITASSSAFSTFFPNWKLVLSPAFKSWMLVFTSALYRTRRWFQCSFFGSSQCLPSSFTSIFIPIALTLKSAIWWCFYAPPSHSFLPLLNFLYWTFFFLIHQNLRPLTCQAHSILSLALILGTSVTKSWFIWRLALYNVLTCYILIFIFFSFLQPGTWCFEHIFLKPL